MTVHARVSTLIAVSINTTWCESSIRMHKAVESSFSYSNIKENKGTEGVLQAISVELGPVQRPDHHIQDTSTHRHSQQCLSTEIPQGSLNVLVHVCFTGLQPSRSPSTKRICSDARAFAS